MPALARDAAPVSVKSRIPLGDIQKLISIHPPSLDAESPRRTDIRPRRILWQPQKIRLRLSLTVKRDRFSLAKTTANLPDAKALSVHKLRLWVLRFGVAAPRTTQRTPFQKDHCPNAAAVMERVFLNIENKQFLHKIK